MLTCLVSVLFTLYIQIVLKLKKKNNNSGAKGLKLCGLNDSLNCSIAFHELLPIEFHENTFTVSRRERVQSDGQNDFF